MSAVQAAVELSRHPLQRLDSPSKGFSGVVHVLGLVSFYRSFKYLADNPTIINESFGWHLQYLTILGLSISTACFVCGLLADITNLLTLFKLKNYLALVAAPIEVIISILYWGLRVIDQSLVIPPNLPVAPILDDIGFHLSPAIFLVTDVLLLSPPWPTRPINPRASFFSFLTSTTIAFLYWFWIEFCYSRNGFYPYPIFALLSTSQRVGLFVMTGIAMWIVGIGLRWAYRVLNGAENEGKRGRGKME